MAKDWEARHDAHMLSEASQIRSDAPRLAKAKTAATQVAKEQKDQLKHTQAVANISSKQAPKSADKPKKVVIRKKASGLTGRF